MKSRPAESTVTATSGLSRRSFLGGLALLFVTAPMMKLSETIARAKKREHHHAGNNDGIWIGHC